MSPTEIKKRDCLSTSNNVTNWGCSSSSSSSSSSSCLWSKIFLKQLLSRAQKIFSLHGNWRHSSLCQYPRHCSLSRKNSPSNFVRTTFKASSLVLLRLSNVNSLGIFRTLLYCPSVILIIRYNNKVHRLWVFIEQLVVTEVFKKFIAVLIKSHQFFLSWARRFQSKSSHPILRCDIVIYFHLCLGRQFFRLSVFFPPPVPHISPLS